MKIRIFTICILLSIIGLVAVSCEQTLSIKRDYDFTIQTEKYHEDLSVGETLTLNLRLDLEGEYEDAEYFVSYFLRKGEGTVSDVDWNVLNENSYYKIAPDQFVLHYTAASKGSHKIELQVKDSSGKEKELVIDLSVKE